ncbi:hypothetical protein M0R45_001099 [Rubus argutus]|uniref:Uncharacterized protein n=1 Tax=Rubus argutus TaxID=59490 RepID=A0AAW1VJ09_RUBAR
MICQNSLKDGATNENTESLDKGISEVKANNEDAVGAGVEVEKNVDDCKHDLVVSKENLDTMSDYADMVK